ncbi:MAG: hypothetical protein ABIX46_11525, partial [Burkholderiaceae bacterium]
MSYILDALRRADADRERERGAVPGLHAQPLAPAATLVPRPRAAIATGALALLVTAAAVGWALWRWQAEPVTVAAAAAP